ncbi:MAG: NYN domain-containing protein [Ruaniaceae bacterium]|nr:NYN domain-containing protein [Ruaniaceae bacterium]
MSVLGRRPNPDERPRWDRVLSFPETEWGRPARGLFFLNASSGQMPMSFVQALLAMDFRPIPLASDGDEKVVDVGIQRTLEAISAQGEGDVILASHDGDFVPQVESLLRQGRRVGVLCFREFLSAQLAELEGIEVYDLESDVEAFNAVLPRVRIIPLASFDPKRYL